jgi:hypothetical protein
VKGIVGNQFTFLYSGEASPELKTSLRVRCAIFPIVLTFDRPTVGVSDETTLKLFLPEG